MRTAVIFILLLVCTKCAYTQEQPKFKRTSIGVFFSPAYCFRSLNYHQNKKWIQEQRNNIERPVFGYSTGIQLKYQINQLQTITTGLLFRVNGEQTKYQPLEWSEQVGAYPVKSKTQFQYQYLELPFNYTKYFGNSNLKFVATAGLSLCVFTQKKTKVLVQYNDGTKNNTKSSMDIGYLKFNIAASVGAGIEYNFSKKISVIVEPVYSRILNSIVSDKTAKEYNYAIQCNFSVFYKLKKRN